MSKEQGKVRRRIVAQTKKKKKKESRRRIDRTCLENIEPCPSRQLFDYTGKEVLLGADVSRFASSFQLTWQHQEKGKYFRFDHMLNNLSIRKKMDDLLGQSVTTFRLDLLAFPEEHTGASGINTPSSRDEDYSFSENL
ncbi:hypothetical protein YC2023_112149 [Brassica napus]